MVVQCTWMPWLKCKEEIYALPLKANCLPQTGTHFYHTLTNCSVQVFGLLQKKWSFKFHYCVNRIDGANWFEPLWIIFGPGCPGLATVAAAFLEALRDPSPKLATTQATPFEEP